MCRVINMDLLTLFFFHADTQFDLCHLLKMLPFSQYVFLVSLSKIRCPHFWVYIWVFNSISSISLSVFMPMPIPYSYNYYRSVGQLEIREADTSSFFIVQACCCYPGVLCFHVKMRTVLSEICVGILIVIVLNLYIVLVKWSFKPTNLWPWEILPSFDIYFNLFLQWFEIVTIQVFYLFG